MKKVQITTVCQVADQTLFFRNNRWIDAKILDKEADAPESTIEFASADYFKLADELAKLNRQSVLAQDGDVYLLHSGYNRWADTNALVVLYPQVGASYWPRFNPRGCWDWWGYTGQQYATKQGPQVRAVKAMVDRLAAPRAN